MDFQEIFKQSLNIFNRGGLAMWPLLGLSILSLSVILERLWFWVRIQMREKEIVQRVLDAAGRNWQVAAEIAQQYRRKPIGRFLDAPLRLSNPDPEVFKLALEAAADDELSLMRQGDKILEAVIALAPLLGLLGTVLGLIRSLNNIRLGESSSMAEVPKGIAEALTTTATGLVLAIVTLAFYRMFQAFLFNQVKIFRKTGNELELRYRQDWPKVSLNDRPVKANLDSKEPPENNNLVLPNEDQAGYSNGRDSDRDRSSD